MLNVLQIQQFYYVGLHRGIAAAARSMPQARTPSAINKAMSQLEDAYGQALFERTPFRFTAAGSAFFEFIRPFFEGLERFLAADHQAAPELRIAGSDVALRYLNDLLELLRERHASTRVRLRSASQCQMHTWLRDGAIDLLIAPGHDPRPPGIEAVRLVSLPLMLLVPRKSPHTSAARLWAGPPPTDPLVVPGPSESVVAHFEAGLRTMRLTWPPTIDAHSLTAVAALVAEGRGVGVAVDEPSLTRHSGVRALALPGFAPVEVMAFTRSPTRPLEKLLIDVLRHRARATWPNAR